MTIATLVLHMNSFQKQTIPNSPDQDLDSISNVDEANDACSAVSSATTAASNYSSRPRSNIPKLSNALTHFDTDHIGSHGFTELILL